MTSSPTQCYVKPADETNFKVYISIDFGTDGLGLAYAINEEVYVHSRWNSKKYGDVVKPKTIILLDDKGDAVSFGMDAKFTYMNLATTQKNTWMLFERFKMSLYEDQICYSDQEEDDEFHDQEDEDNENKENFKKNHKKLEVKSDEFDEKILHQTQRQRQKQRIRIKNELIAVNGKTYSSEKVFVAAFKYIKKEAKKYLRKKKIKNINDDEIGWILTVPSIWNDESKNKMKQWAITAELVNRNIVNQCKIVYEPDCASLAIANELNKINKINKINTMKIGDKYILIDAGGGTIDIACHEIIDIYPSFSVKEIFAPSGGKWGSCYIDDEYIKLLENIFSTNWMNEFKLLSPNIFVEIIHNFQQAKAKFFDHETSTEKSKHNVHNVHNVRLPEDFICFIDEKIDEVDGMEDVEEFVNKSVLGLSQSICLDDEYLQIDYIVWKSMFDHSINPTIMHINNKLLKYKYKYLCLVGGLSTSKYFQFRMKNEFGPSSKYGLQLIIPRRPILCVVEGAAYFGIKSIAKEYMKARRLRLTYGFVVNKPIDLAKEMGISDEYISENKYFDPINNEYMVAGCFVVMARKNQQVLLDHVFIESSFRSDPNNMEVRSQVMCSDIVDPKTVQDGHELAEYTVFCKNKHDMEVIDEFHFYDTMLKVYSYSKNSPHIKTEIELSYN